MFGRRKKDLFKAVDRKIIRQVTDDDAEALSLVLKMRDHYPLILNFDLLDIMAANKMIAFFSGACVAIDGKIITIKDGTYLFATSPCFDDGSLVDFVDKLKN